MSDQDRAAPAGVAEHAPYVLGSEAAEVARLDAQARTIEQASVAPPGLRSHARAGR